ncbi:DUF397 domain-containing protein [Streptomyces sp. NPDC059680]|uniref:DUF397 domain-containing protein n=1 Tax=Streptomyces TaxID=1883 RepID=UPI001E4E5E94|nr:DUF397 domain-containing protein [Streptomyces barringtoniae]MCC5473838.1 DUF397 domain-containing protein [Streptomyces barringtoniae]
MRIVDLSAASWRKSSRSNQDGGACIEVSDDFDAVVPVRDSKRVNGPVIVFASDGWASFVTALKRGDFGA